MRYISRKSSFAVGASVALVVGMGSAYAATGSTFLSGYTNYATTTTGIYNTAGTPLALTARAGYAPMTVNSAARVTNLNADRLDGFSSESLALTTGRTGFITGSIDDADGYANTARCPAGTIAVGGGGFASDLYDYLYYSGPDTDEYGNVKANSWAVFADGWATAYVNCYNPRGNVPGASTSLGLSQAASGNGVAAPAGGQKRLR